MKSFACSRAPVSWLLIVSLLRIDAADPSAVNSDMGAWPPFYAIRGLVSARPTAWGEELTIRVHAERYGY